LDEGTIAATRAALDTWTDKLPQPWMAGMEATLFTGWIYDHLIQKQVPVKVAHSAMLKAICSAKKKNDRVDAQKLADLLRCDYFSGMPHRAAGSTRPSPRASLPKHARPSEHPNEEQNRFSAYGDGGTV